jgi:hypothetical protein
MTKVVSTKSSKCITCHRAHIGQTKLSLKLRYQEHIQYIRNNNPQSAYALHILNNRHEYGPMHNTMGTFKTDKKTNFLIPYEQIHSVQPPSQTIDTRVK